MGAVWMTVVLPCSRGLLLAALQPCICGCQELEYPTHTAYSCTHGASALKHYKSPSRIEENSFSFVEKNYFC